MPAPDFASFFQFATDNRPYAYQCRLACGPEADPEKPETLCGGTVCESRLIDIPTGLGKTAAVVLAWLWNRMRKSEMGKAEGENTPWPRRLVYCLPMRTLVEQTANEAKKWVDNLRAAGGFESEPPKIYLLIGGEETEQWDLYPEKDAILIGTQDMLLSRALNRGYGMSRYRWPMHFGLLNNDCLWVLDETQLMGVGIETSAQFDGFRTLWHREKPSPTWWMSATLEDSQLATVDHPTPEQGWPRLHLEENDREKVRHRLEALKHLEKAPLTVTKQFKAAELAKLVLRTHLTNHLTLVIVNRVQRAQDLYLALQKQGRTDGLALVHSRFREPDRQEHQKLLITGKKDPSIKDRIVIATQAIEAGIDVSARVLITELAPWSSLVQRFGRCNRGGEFNTEGADIHWIDLQFEKDEDTAPYSLAEIKDARIELEKLEGKSVSPEKLAEIKVTPPSVIRPVIRRKDLIDLFDTTPDIAGHDLDVSRYIREGDDTDVQVYWRALNASDGKPSLEAEAPARAELCNVAVHRFRAFLKKLNEFKDGPRAWIWDGLREEWMIALQARAGATYLVDHRAGGYDPKLGWTGEIAKKPTQWVPPIPTREETVLDATSRDPLTRIGRPLTLVAHTENVLRHMRDITTSLTPTSADALLTAARWHDVGKAQEDFQAMLRAAAGADAPAGILAKSGKKGGSLPDWRKHFRHELASALAWLFHYEKEDQADLIAYIIAAHHGKVRLSIRSLPGEQPPKDKPVDTLIARGIIDGDVLSPIPGYTETATTLSLGLMRMGSDDNGRPSWLARMIALRDRLGPFQLAYLETLLRAADMRASAEEAQPPSPQP